MPHTQSIDPTDPTTEPIARRHRPGRRRWLRLDDERGEGVISAAIAVLIMAFLGVGMWVGFQAIFDDANDNIADQVDQIGDDGPAPAPAPGE